MQILHKLTLTIILTALLLPATSKPRTEDSFCKIKAKVRAPEIKKKSWTDKKVEELINKYLGNDFRRAGIYDLFPEIEILLEDPELIKLAEYHNYSRNDLRKISQGEALKAFNLDFDMDGASDFATIIHNKITSDNLLFISNTKKVIFLDLFSSTYLELLNYGNYPTTVPTKTDKRTLSSPAIKLVSFDGNNFVLYYNRSKKLWEKIALLY